VSNDTIAAWRRNELHSPPMRGLGTA